MPVATTSGGSGGDSALRSLLQLEERIWMELDTGAWRVMHQMNGLGIICNATCTFALKRRLLWQRRAATWGVLACTCFAPDWTKEAFWM